MFGLTHVVRPLGFSRIWLLNWLFFWYRSVSAIGWVELPPYPIRS